MVISLPDATSYYDIDFITGPYITSKSLNPKSFECHYVMILWGYRLDIKTELQAPVILLNELGKREKHERMTGILPLFATSLMH